MSLDVSRLPTSRRQADYVLVKLGKIALVLRLVCTYPVALGWADGGSLRQLLLLAAVVAVSLTALLAWDRVAQFVARHPFSVAVDIVLGLVVFASAYTPNAYMGYLGSTAVIIGLFVPVVGQVLLTSLLSLGYLLVVAIHAENNEQFTGGPTMVAASIVLMASLTFVGNSMQKLQRQVNTTVDQARQAAAEATLGQERSRLARELHDSLVKSLEGISLQAKAMVIGGKAVEEASMISSAATQSIQDSRQLLRGLREDSVPPLASSLKTLADEIGAMYPVSVGLDVQGCLELPLDMRYCAQKIAEEALVNAARHSGANRLQCAAHCREGALSLTVRDSGKGFTMRDERTARKSDHFGLAGMRERAEDLGGTLTVNTQQGGGTQVMLRLPAKEQKEKL